MLTPAQCTTLKALAMADQTAATQSAGWAAVKAVISRFGTRAEMALATGAGTQAAPSTPAFDGQLGYMEIPPIRTA